MAAKFASSLQKSPLEQEARGEGGARVHRPFISPQITPSIPCNDA